MDNQQRSDKPTVLVTGGAGYIGSHMCVQLISSGHNVVVLDNLSNSTARSLKAVERITQTPLTFVKGDIRDSHQLDQIFADHQITAVLHFAGLKAVGESVAQPLKYYDINVSGSLRLLEAMERASVRTIVFSSSATVYGIPETAPIDESCPTQPINPYGDTKLAIEHVLRDTAQADPRWHISALRYFNPVGAHASGEIGEDPQDIPNNLMPYIAQVAVGRQKFLRVFGNDYPTPDGTGIRDYIHVVDLARGHLSALEYLKTNPGFHIHNLGTGRGYSVLEAVAAFERASGKDIPCQVMERRPGDAAISFADPKLARIELNWQAEYGLDRMCADAWRWQSQYPMGFQADD